MAIINWGLLSKSAVDSEKIEEAIARLIDVHNDDESSHLDVGQALQSHKAAQIIDHLAASIVEDKLKDWSVTPIKIAMLFFTTFFESLDGYEKTAGVSLNTSLGRVEMATTAVTNNYQYLEKLVYYTYSDWDWDHDRFFEMTVDVTAVTDQEVWLVTGALGTGNHLGFKIVDNKLYGTVADDTTEKTVELLTVVAFDVYKLYFEYVAGSKIDFYVDGVLLGTITENLPTGIVKANDVFDFYILTKADAIKRVRFTFFDLRQKI